MNKLSSTALLIAVSLLTAVAVTVGATPLTWLLVYAGWLLLAQYAGRAILAELQAEKAQQGAKAPAEAVQVRPAPILPRRQDEPRA